LGTDERNQHRWPTAGLTIYGSARAEPNRGKVAAFQSAGEEILLRTGAPNLPAQIRNLTGPTPTTGGWPLAHPTTAAQHLDRLINRHLRTDLPGQ